MIEFLILLHIIILILILLQCLLLLFQDTRLIRNPLIIHLLVAIPDEAFLYTIFLFRLSTEIEEIVDIVHLVVSVFYVLFESLELEINLKTLLSADKATRFLILLLRISLLSQFTKLINDSPRKYLRNNFLSKQNIRNLAHNLKAKPNIIIIGIHI